MPKRRTGDFPNEDVPVIIDSVTLSRSYTHICGVDLLDLWQGKPDFVSISRRAVCLEGVAFEIYSLEVRESGQLFLDILERLE